MNELFNAAVENYGFTALLAALILLIIFWAIVHGLAEPGKKISYLRGLVSYTKKYQRARDRKKPKVINVIEEGSDTLWRIVHPIKDWIDGDINDFESFRISNILIGPFHARCKNDLSYWDRSYSSSGWRIRRTCGECEVEIIPESISNDREDMKTYVLKQLQQLYLQGTKIKNGMTI